MALISFREPVPVTGRTAGITAFLPLAFLGTQRVRRQTAAGFRDA